MFEGLEGTDPYDGGIIAREVVLVKQVPYFQLHQLQELRVLHGVYLVEGHYNAGDLHLTRQEYVFPGLGHGPVGGADHQDCAVHLSGAGDHVLDIVGVAGAVHMSVVALRGLVFNVCDGNGEAPRFFFWCVINGVEGAVASSRPQQRPGPG